MDKARQVDAASKIEDWALAVPEVIRQLRMGVSNPLAHAMVYTLRAELGLILRDMPYAQTPPRAEYWTPAREIIESQRHIPR